MSGIETKIEFRCSFCGGHIFAPDLDSDPQQKAFLIHSKPACEKYLQMDVMDFLVANRKAAGITAPWDTEDVEAGGKPQ